MSNQTEVREIIQRQLNEIEVAKSVTNHTEEDKFLKFLKENEAGWRALKRLYEEAEFQIEEKQNGWNEWRVVKEYINEGLD